MAGQGAVRLQGRQQAIGSSEKLGYKKSPAEKAGQP